MNLSIGDRVLVTDESPLFAGKFGTVESIDGNIVTVYVAFDEEKGKMVRQDFESRYLTPIPNGTTESVRFRR